MTPVNEYNMSEKIQTANNLLFASSSPDCIVAEPSTTPTMSTIKMNNMKHHVTFSSDIEEYDIDETVLTVDEMEEFCGTNGDEIDDIDDIYAEDEQCHSPKNEIDTNIDECSENDETISIIAGEEMSELEMKNIQISNEDKNEREIRAPSRRTFNASDENKKNPIKKSQKSKNIFSSQSEQKVHAQHHQLLKIHLNVRKCCEFRYLENDRLPRYNGYISQYGLNKDQLDDLERNKLFKRQRSNEMRKQFREKMAQKSAENEQAFAKWLYHKQKTAKSRTKNMYDSK